MEQFIHEFGINWKLMVAQLINFSILLFILARFVYKPIVKLLDERKKKIEEGIAFSNKSKEELARIEVLKASELKRAELEGQKIVKAAEVSATRVADDVLANAEKEKVRIVEAGKTILLSQKATMERDFYQEAAGVVKDALSKVLVKGTFTKEEESLIHEALEQVNTK